MNTHLHQRSVVAATVGWLREHTLLAVVGLVTGLALTVAAAQSLLSGSVLPFVFFLILGAVILRGVLRLDTGGHRNEGKHQQP